MAGVVTKLTTTSNGNGTRTPAWTGPLSSTQDLSWGSISSNLITLWSSELTALCDQEGDTAARLLTSGTHCLPPAAHRKALFVLLLAPFHLLREDLAGPFSSLSFTFFFLISPTRCAWRHKPNQPSYIKLSWEEGGIGDNTRRYPLHVCELQTIFSSGTRQHHRHRKGPRRRLRLCGFGETR